MQILLVFFLFSFCTHAKFIWHFQTRREVTIENCLSWQVRYNSHKLCGQYTVTRILSFFEWKTHIKNIPLSTTFPHPFIILKKLLISSLWTFDGFENVYGFEAVVSLSYDLTILDNFFTFRKRKIENIIARKQWIEKDLRFPFVLLNRLRILQQLPHNFTIEILNGKKWTEKNLLLGFSWTVPLCQIYDECDGEIMRFICEHKQNGICKVIGN